MLRRAVVRARMMLLSDVADCSRIHGLWSDVVHRPYRRSLPSGATSRCLGHVTFPAASPCLRGFAARASGGEANGARSGSDGGANDNRKKAGTWGRPGPGDAGVGSEPSAGWVASKPARASPAAGRGSPSPLGSAAVAPGAAPAGVGPSPPTLRDVLADQVHITLPSYAPGQHRLVCPQCRGGSDGERSLAVRVEPDGNSALWNCFRGTCGWAGSVQAGENAATRITYTAPGSTAAKKGAGGGGVDATSGAPIPYRARGSAPPQSGPGGRTGPPGGGYTVPTPRFEPLGDRAMEFFRSRRISEATLSRNGVMQETTYSPAAGRETAALAFPYFRGGRVVNIKYRGPGKTFWQVKGAEKVLYGLDDVTGASEIIIVEGEMDKLAMEEAGYVNVVSVPDGAPPAVKPGALPPPESDVKYEYLWACRQQMDAAARIVIATDNDGPGIALAEELARRLGRERCWRVRWHRPPGISAADPGVSDRPSGEFDSAIGDGGDGLGDGLGGTDAAPEVGGGDGGVWAGADDHRKDANEVLIKDGPAAVRANVEAAEPLPIRGLFRFADFFSEIDALYALPVSGGAGVSTGWAALDPLYRVVPGELTVVTGVPNSGKSEWLDALLCNLARLHGWSFGLCSMENKVREHGRKLLEKWAGQPFFDAPYAASVRRMSASVRDAGKEWLDGHFYLIRCEDDALPSVDWVLGIARAAVLRYGIRGLVVDPYNELDHQRPSNMSETEYVSQILGAMKRFAQHHDCHVWFVAHPRMMRDWRGEPPGLYDIAGSAHFINKCDNGLVVHRNRDEAKGPLNETRILLRKVRNKAAGEIGDATLAYDRATGRYYDTEAALMADKARRFVFRYRYNRLTSVGAPVSAPQAALAEERAAEARAAHERAHPSGAAAPVAPPNVARQPSSNWGRV